MDARLNDSYLRAVLAERRAGGDVQGSAQRPRDPSGPVRRFAAHLLVHVASRLDRTAVRDRTHNPTHARRLSADGQRPASLPPGEPAAALV